jgi:hypothetical protein
MGNDPVQTGLCAPAGQPPRPDDLGPEPEFGAGEDVAGPGWVRQRALGESTRLDAATRHFTREHARERLNWDGLVILCALVPASTYRIGSTMIVLGIILLVIGYFTGISILYTIGGILVVVGVILWILGAVGRPVGGRKVWF